MTRIVYKTHSHTHIHTYAFVHLQRGQLRRSISATTHSTHPPPFEGVLQNIPIHQRELIAQEYIGYKSLRYISSVHQLADFLYHSSIILRITSANFQNLKFEIWNFLLNIRDKVPFECCPLLFPARGQFHSWAHIHIIYYAYVCVCCICTYKNIFILMNLYSCLFPALTAARSTATWCFYILANILVLVWEELNSIRLCHENRDFIAQVFA